MKKDERDLVDVLKFELEFLEKGGYGASHREPRKVGFFFEDSPACMNYDSKENPDPCGACVLMRLVPPDQRQQTIPCRHIPLNVAGETLASLYRHAEQRDLEDVYGKWLRTTIAILEEERLRPRGAAARPHSPARSAAAGEPLFGKLHPKCANPGCIAAFHWLAGGTFFRFGPRTPQASGKGLAMEGSKASPPADTTTRHYWLCDSCSQAYTLSYEEGRGIILEMKWPELPAGDPVKHSVARL
ncbi:MAG TPA: hypothetical protein VKG84_05635 [Candidatus Acidoferrales bacterium]|nr:hypothetical protein [Candidatus Acidoferrales bacterium]